MIPSITPITTRCIPVDSDQCATCTDEEWESLMAAKYGISVDLDDFTDGPAQPNQHSDS